MLLFPAYKNEAFFRDKVWELGVGGIMARVSAVTRLVCSCITLFCGRVGGRDGSFLGSRYRARFELGGFRKCVRRVSGCG
jgi:hypothetical protein